MLTKHPFFFTFFFAISKFTLPIVAVVFLLVAVVVIVLVVVVVIVLVVIVVVFVFVPAMIEKFFVRRKYAITCNDIIIPTAKKNNKHV